MCSRLLNEEIVQYICGMLPNISNENCLKRRSELASPCFSVKCYKDSCESNGNMNKISCLNIPFSYCTTSEWLFELTVLRRKYIYLKLQFNQQLKIALVISVCGVYLYRSLHMHAMQNYSCILWMPKSIWVHSSLQLRLQPEDPVFKICQ